MGKNRGDYKHEAEQMVEYLNKEFPDLHLYYLAASSSSHVLSIRGSVIKSSTGPKPLCDFLEGFRIGLKQSKHVNSGRVKPVDVIARYNRFRTRSLSEM